MELIFREKSFKGTRGKPTKEVKKEEPIENPAKKTDLTKLGY
jgi:hypothetical protein